MKLAFFIVIFGCLSSFSFGQKNKYDEFLTKGEKKISSSYHELYSQKANEYIRRVFFPELNLMTAEYRFKDKKCTKREGVQQEWWDNGYRRSIKVYKNNELIGIDTSFHFDNGKISSITWRNDKVEVDSTKFYNKNGWMNGFSIYSNGQDFIKIDYDSLGIIRRKCFYKGYELIRCEPLDTAELSKPRFDTICNNSKTIATDCGVENLFAWLSQGLKYPSFAKSNGVTGKALTRFTIDKEGNLIDIVVMSGLCQSIKEEAIRVLKSSPPWIPGKKDGQPVKVMYTLPLTFKLEN